MSGWVGVLDANTPGMLAGVQPAWAWVELAHCAAGLTLCLSWLWVWLEVLERRERGRAGDGCSVDSGEFRA